MVKRGHGTSQVIFSKEPMNLKNIHSRKVCIMLGLIDKALKAWDFRLTDASSYRTLDLSTTRLGSIDDE
jgi:hypothetical protein